MPQCVLKEWVFFLPFRMQSVLMSALRGCDTARKDDPSKFITRAIRALLLNNADPTNSFIVEGLPEDKYVKSFLWDLDSYPLHFVMHTTHAVEILGYKHPDPEMRPWWAKFYQDLVKALHLNPELESQLDIRLGFTSTEKKAEEDLDDNWAALGRPRKESKDPKWDAGTGTSHGGRERPWSGGS